MIERYTRPEMGALWTDEHKFQTWLDVELAACEAMAKAGQIPRKDWAAIRRKAAFDVKRIRKIEAEVRHDVIAFLTNVAETSVRRRGTSTRADEFRRGGHGAVGESGRRRRTC
jgi:adenylosuccinate lyase